MIITIIGASSPNMSEYIEAYNLGRKVGIAGHILKNGACGGIMEASAKGCSEVGGQVIGIAVIGHKKPNDYNSKVITKDSVKDKIDELLNTDALVVLDGKLGTLEELFVAWMKNVEGCKFPIIIVGKNFGKLVRYFAVNNLVQLDYLKYLCFVDSIDDFTFQEGGKIVFERVYLMNYERKMVVYKDKVFNNNNMLI